MGKQIDLILKISKEIFCLNILDNKYPTTKLLIDMHLKMEQITGSAKIPNFLIYPYTIPITMLDEFLKYLYVIHKCKGMKTDDKKKKTSGTKEWVGNNINLQNGCQNNCKYCYARVQTVARKLNPKEWNKEIIHQKDIDKFLKRKKEFNCHLMFLSSHDITPENINDVVKVGKYLVHLLTLGYHILFVTKPILECLKILCKEFSNFKDKILFRFTIGSMDDEILKFWESDVSLASERIESLKCVYIRGFR